ncbi:MAG TPA: helix-turn-helix transcriptional regulator [Mycobacteriales bacterium]|jgi:MerR family transcriptional regulator/heat shock protein HspR|nr:helix-turn-helix transcriptional regulator [Mycobacteriales bacterium]
MTDGVSGDFGFPPSGAVPDDAPVYVISVAATLAGMHPQTLRQYDRLGLVSPDRTPGRGRRYSARDIELLRQVQRLSQDEGVNLAGVKRILELEAHVDALRARLTELLAELDATRAEVSRREAQVHQSYRRDLVPVDRGAMVVWRPQPPQH